MKQSHSILLYYCYTPIDNPEEFREQHHRYCIEKGILGRIIIAKEGINGTVSGLTDACESYMRDLSADARFVRTHFKVAAHHKHAFQKLHVRVKNEIVHAGLPHILPHQRTGPYITPKALQQMQQEEELVLLDVRSNYEHKLGKFKGAITLDINHFREFPNKIEELMPLQQKKIITYCTGGVKCEKASAYLLEKGFQDVYQLYGGIIQYGCDTDGKDFEGTCYVFDNRLTTNINKYNPSIVGRCYVCHIACDRIINCANPACNKHTPICESCAADLAGACSPTCQRHPRKRLYNGTGYYTMAMNGYNPYQGLVRKQKK
ncbi:MAG: oxygen-dependent tRNA uridine(34) hydroxylase TrhO [Bacteroidota bacterium]